MMMMMVIQTHKSRPENQEQEQEEDDGNCLASIFPRDEWMNEWISNNTQHSLWSKWAT